MKKNNKKFDCLKMKDQVQAEIYEKISGMSLSEERDFYNQEVKDEKFASWLARVKKHSASQKLKKSG